MNRNIIESMRGEVFHTHGFNNVIKVVLTDTQTGERYEFSHTIPYTQYMNAPVRLSQSNALQLITHCKTLLKRQWAQCV